MSQQSSQVPLEMRQSSQWVAWKLTHIKGKPKPTKVPRQPKNPHMGADTTKPEHWGTLESAMTAKIQANLDGVGYVFTGTPHAGVDLDNAFDAEGVLHPWAAEIVRRFEDCSYVEWSPSGNGLHLITTGSLLPDAWHNKHLTVDGVKVGLECYDTERFFTVTGKPYADFSGLEIGDGQAALDWLQVKFAKAKTEAKDKSQKKTQPDPETMGFEDQVLIDQARQAVNGAKFDALMRGDLSEHGDDHSSADMALCNILTYWTRRDPAQIDRIFRKSKLMREKWDSRRGADTYGSLTIRKALEMAQDSGESGWNPGAGQRATMGEAA